MPISFRQSCLFGFDLTLVIKKNISSTSHLLQLLKVLDLHYPERDLFYKLQYTSYIYAMQEKAS